MVVEVVNALQAKRKLGFIKGTLKKPEETSPDLENWLTVNSMIVGWIRASIEPKVRSTVTYITEAYQLWEDLKQRFSVGNNVRVHQIKAHLASCRQKGLSVLDYFGNLSKLWEELQVYQPIHACTCGAAAAIAKEREHEKIHQFMMGLDDSRFVNISTSVIGLDLLPSLGEIYNKMVREEQRLASARSHEQQEARDYWQLVRFPDRYNERSGGRGQGFGNRGRGRGMNSRGRGQENIAQASVTSSNSSFPEFSADQWKVLSQMIQEKAGNQASDKLFGKNKLGDVILDTGASHHMTGNRDLLTHLETISPCSISFADGNRTFADRFSRTLIGAGEERDGVYYFTDLVSVKSHRAVRVSDHVMWHQCLGHPSFSVFSDLSFVSKSASSSPCDTFFRELPRLVEHDNGTEFMVMSSLFKDQDIVHQTSCVNTPQQNCRFERKHKHILNVSCALLFQANLPIKFWGKAVLTAAYLINRNPSSVLNGRSYYEVIHGVAPDYKALRVFGSVCYVHRTSRDKDKFGPRSRLCVFVGYPIGKKCWKVYDIDRNVFLVSRDVVFREDLFPYADQKTEPADGSPIDTVSDEDWNLPPLGRKEEPVPVIPPAITVSEAPPASNSESPLPVSETLHASIQEVSTSAPEQASSPTNATNDAEAVVPETLGRGQQKKTTPVRLRDYLLQCNS
ncbi:uncharacterized protein LOC108835766 [Raphanus sativus]|uniref:Uncharacterized protein LOC108835766 n=1 Tax=Raphanus sativus TaxID=3726 RepID=A0A9W3D8Q1_RAPSA|nr:uncharacterized protein LOC108835766 [Raphanus sativus]